MDTKVNPAHQRIRKLLQRHRRELTGIIGSFRATVHGEWNSLKLTVKASGRTYVASATLSNGDGRPDWLNVDTPNGRFIATLE